MSSLLACLCGFTLDLLLGDPLWLYHPVRLIGAWIAFLEKCMRKIAGADAKKLLVAGGVLWALVILVSTGVPWLLLILAGRLHPGIRFVLECFWCYQILAARALFDESRRVYLELKKGDLPAARKAVARIVGRDTERLEEAGVVRAAVETVAENTSDGITAPLLFMMIGGAPLAFLYKAVNTMDSMLGYKEEKYLYLGRVPAKMDDLFNYIPARLSALFMLAAAWILRMDAKQAWKIYRRDRRKHASPNAAQTEAVCAGALDVQLAGDAWYFGKRYQKETIGDAMREVEAKDILRAGWLMYGTAILSLIVFGGVRWMIFR
ncbi:MAG: cobalamin biosynthesis protein CobD [Hespellia sp.]|nr:cobalamin biosynthesis protein CobD [Hespellia sp.]